jgi:hypothetical protein
MGLTALAGLLAFGGVGFVLSQDAFRRHRASTVVPSMQTAQLVVPVGIAMTLYGQALPAGPAATLGWLVAFGLIAVGIVVLSGSVQVVATLADGTPSAARGSRGESSTGPPGDRRRGRHGGGDAP